MNSQLIEKNLLRKISHQHLMPLLFDQNITNGSLSYKIDDVNKIQNFFVVAIFLFHEFKIQKK